MGALAEIEQETEFESRGGEVVDDLILEGGRESLDGFEFDDNDAADEQIDAVFADDLAAEVYGKRFFSLEGDGSVAERAFQRALVDRLAEAVAELAVHLVEGAEDFMAQVFVEEQWHCGALA